MFLVGGIMQPATAAAEKRLLVQVNEIVLIAMSGGVLLVEKRGRLRPLTLLQLGLFFEVAVACGIAVFENSIARQADAVIRGFSACAVWVAAYTLLVPMPPFLTQLPHN